MNFAEQITGRVKNIYETKWLLNFPLSTEENDIVSAKVSKKKIEPAGDPR